MTLCASLIGVTSLIFNAKGNPFGQFLMVVFSLLYGMISYSFAYYGEMVTYLGMTMPMAIFALISWLRNPYNGNKSEVKVNRISKKENVCMWLVLPLEKPIFIDLNSTCYWYCSSHFLEVQYTTSNSKCSKAEIPVTVPATKTINIRLILNFKNPAFVNVNYY
jgi:hypothetical protein